MAYRRDWGSVGSYPGNTFSDPETGPSRRRAPSLSSLAVDEAAGIQGHQRKRARKRGPGGGNGLWRAKSSTAFWNVRTPRIASETPGEARKRPRLRALRSVERRFHLATTVEGNDLESKLRKRGRGSAFRFQEVLARQSSLTSKHASGRSPRPIARRRSGIGNCPQFARSFPGPAGLPQSLIILPAVHARGFCAPTRCRHHARSSAVRVRRWRRQRGRR